MNTFELIKFVLSHPQSCDSFLGEVNDIATDCGIHEFPLHDEDVKLQIREALIRWLFHVSDAKDDEDMKQRQEGK